MSPSQAPAESRIISSRTKILEVRDLRFVRGPSVILDQISWAVARGENWAIVGPNGCGKTSLLRILVGYLSATSGEIFLLGEQYGHSDWRDLRRQIGLVTSALQPSIPAAEKALETVVSGKYAQLDLWAKISRKDRIRAGKCLGQVKLLYLAGREWLYLSQGERQRILIARALMAGPRLLILDEPCAGLDPVARDSFLKFLGKLGRRKSGPALVLVTHHVEEIVPAFSHVLLLRAGTVVAAGEKMKVLTSKNLSATFGHPLKVRTNGATLSLSVLPKSRKKLS